MPPGTTTAADRPPRSGRDAACRRLTAQAALFPELRPGGPETGGLDPREAAFASAIYAAAVRRWTTLAFLLDARLRQPMHRVEPALRAVLLCGAAQLLFLDRVPPHAAIDESVEWAKRRIRPGAGKLVNAVLRRIDAMIERDGDGRAVRRETWERRRDELPRGDGGAIALREDALPEDDSKRFAVATGLSASVLARWAESGGPGVAEARAVHSLAEPPVVLNVGHDAVPSDDPRLTAHETGGHAVYVGEPGGLGELLEQRPGVWVQDTSSSAALESVAHLEPARVIDLCAGLGTKTRQALALFPRAEVWAADTDTLKLDVLRRSLGTNDRLRIATGDEEPPAADLVIADVPCSNSGVLARRIEARHRLAPPAIARMVRVQRQILERARGLVAPGGVLLYATCSVEAEENDAQPAWAAAEFDLTVESRRGQEPRGKPGGPAHGYADGSFSAVLRVGG